MGRRTVEMTPELLQQMWTVGHRLDNLECVEGLPPGAVHIKSWYEDDELFPGGRIVMLFEHEAWPPLDGDGYEAIRVTVEQKEATE